MTNEELQTYYDETNKTLTVLTALLNCPVPQITTETANLINLARNLVQKDQAKQEPEPAPKPESKKK
jgi:hypothetical protein